MAGRRGVCLTVAVWLFIGPSTAAAQEEAAAGVGLKPDSAARRESSREPRPAVTLGATVGSLLMGNARIDGIGIRAGVPVHRRVDFEMEADWLFRTSTGGGTADSPGAYYFLQAKHTLSDPQPRRYAVFATYGAAGWIQRGPFFFALPILPQVGAGVQFAPGKRYAVRVDAQIILGLFQDLRPLTGRVSGGIAVPLGTAATASAPSRAR